jgi:hypothetical protein
LCLASHGGDKDDIEDSTGQKHLLSELYNSTKNIEKKPKIFLLNNCRGGTEPVNADPKSKYSELAVDNTLLVYATAYDNVRFQFLKNFMLINKL